MANHGNNTLYCHSNTYRIAKIKAVIQGVAQKMKDKPKPNYFIIYTAIAFVSFPFLLMYCFIK